MPIKLVKVIDHDGKKLHQFTCHRVDITTHMILFDGVPARHGDKSVSLLAVERIVVDINQPEGFASIQLVDSKKILHITW